MTKFVNALSDIWDNIVKQRCAIHNVWMEDYVQHQPYAPAQKDTKEDTVKEVNLFYLTQRKEPHTFTVFLIIFQIYFI